MIRSRSACMLLDAALTAGMDAAIAPREGEGRFQPGSRSYRKARRAFGAVAMLLPAAFGRFHRTLLDPSRLPFRQRRVSLLGFGSATTVFLLRADAGEQEEALVLKVYRKSLDGDAATLRRFARERRAECERAASCYRGGGLVLPSRFLVLQSPLLSRPAVGCIQPFVEDGHRDVFLDVPEDELIELLAHGPLRAQLDLLLDRTLGMAETQAACVDLVGRNNLILTESGGAPRLLLIDSGVCDLRLKAERQPYWLEELERRLAYLRRLRERSR